MATDRDDSAGLAAVVMTTRAIGQPLEIWQRDWLFRLMNYHNTNTQNPRR